MYQFNPGPTQKALEQARLDLENVEPHHINIRKTTHAARAFVAEIRAASLHRVANASGGLTAVLGMIRDSGWMQSCGHLEPGDYAAATVLLDILEGSDEFKATSAIVDPILARIADLEAKDQAEREAHGGKAQAHRGAVAKANEKALAAAANDKTVIEAAKALGLAV